MPDDDTRFAPDLYRGTAAYYDRYRLAYPERMLADLFAHAQVGEGARLLDLACGTGQLAVPLSPHFAEVWAVDQEAEMADAVRAKGVAGLRAVASSAEKLDAPPGHFDLIVIGNAFHRLGRDAVARRSLAWLKPQGRLALCWSTSPWVGDAPWQQAFAQTLTRWRARLGVEERVPAGWEQARRNRPDAQVLSEAGFAADGRREFGAEHRWTPAELAGHVRSTSFLPPSAFTDQGAAFDEDLAATLAPFAEDGTFRDSVGFAYDLFRPRTG
jgi:ubiquinone/menaquinone biosynthesis C-methylase UbiE